MKRTRVIFWTDIFIFCAFLITAGIGLPLAFAIFPGFRGSPWKDIHMVSGILLFTGVIFHLALHAKWIGATANRLGKNASWPTRINFCVDFLLAGVFLLICLSGLNRWLSGSGYSTFFRTNPAFWEAMHRGTGIAMAIYVIIHLSLHARWIKNAVGNSIKFHSPQAHSSEVSRTA